MAPQRALPIQPQPGSTSQRLHTPHLALRRDSRGPASPPAIVVVDSAPARLPNSPAACQPRITTSHHPPHSLLDPSTPNTHQSTTNCCPGRPPRVTEARRASVILQPLSLSMAALPIHPQPGSTSQRLHTPHLALRRDSRGSASLPAIVIVDSAPARPPNSSAACQPRIATSHRPLAAES